MILVDRDSPESTEQAPRVELPVNPNALEVGSPLARTLYEVLVGSRVVVVPSPPGAGKTTLVVNLVSRLLDMTTVRICLVAPTNRSAAVAATLIRESGGDEPVAVTLSSGVEKLTTFNSVAGARVHVATIAAMGMRKSGAGYDVMIVDEAYQAILADVLQAAAETAQLVLVGDPGQIGPVVTADTTPWQHLGAHAPHSPAPQFFQSLPETVMVALPNTYRLGAETVEVIAPLYDFPFASARPDTHIETRSGDQLPEIGRLEVPDPSAAHDLATMTTVAKRAVSLVGTVLVREGVAAEVTPNDVAVVVSHNAQVSAVRAAIAGMHVPLLEEIAVGTADSLQGGQWPVVVAVDPLIGHPVATSHSQSTGRLCVMLSRHTAHLTWVYAPGWETALADSDESPYSAERALAAQVRTSLMAHPSVSA